MTVLELKLGIEDFLKNHPEAMCWTVYNPYETTSGTDIYFSPDGNFRTIPEQARAYLWEQQKWFWDRIRTNKEPNEKLRNQWYVDAVRKRIKKYFYDKYPNDKVIDADEHLRPVIEKFDTVADYGFMFCGDIPSILIRFHLKSTKAHKWAAVLPGSLFSVCEKVVKSVSGRQNADETKQLAECMTRRGLDEYGAGRYGYMKEGLIPDETWLTSLEIVDVKNDGIDNGTVFVFTFEA